MALRFQGVATLVLQTIFVIILSDVSHGFVVGRFNPQDDEDTMPFMDHGDGGMGNKSGGGMDHSMKMYFHASAMAMILFMDWMTHSWQQMFGSCVGLFFIAVLYEGLKVGRELLMKKMRPKSIAPDIYPVSDFKGGETSGYNMHSSQHKMIGNGQPRGMSRIFNASHLVQTLLHFLQVWLSFCLMLVFMTYNIWLCLAVTLGAAVGYFSFAWLRSSSEDSNEHCN